MGLTLLYGRLPSGLYHHIAGLYHHIAGLYHHIAGLYHHIATGRHDDDGNEVLDVVWSVRKFYGFFMARKFYCFLIKSFQLLYNRFSRCYLQLYEMVE